MGNRPPDVTVTLTYDQASAIRTLCRIQANTYNLTEGYAPVDVAVKLEAALREAREYRPDSFGPHDD